MYVPLPDLEAETGPVPHANVPVTFHGIPVTPQVATAARRLLERVHPEDRSPAACIEVEVRPGTTLRPGGFVVDYAPGPVDSGERFRAGIIGC